LITLLLQAAVAVAELSAAEVVLVDTELQTYLLHLQLILQ
jgi:hypothetical protein